MKKSFLLLYIYISSILPCEFIDLTDQENSDQRAKLFNNKKNPGVRVSWNDMKSMNKKFGLGTVNTTMSKYEKRIYNQMKAYERNKGVRVTIYKSDFKGYYITCGPSSGCIDEVYRIIKSNDVALFPDKTKFTLSSTKSRSYQEGYILARAKTAYPEIKLEAEVLEDFIDMKMRQGITQATKKTNLASINPNEEEFSLKLSKHIDQYRQQGMSEVPHELRTLILALDVLLEIPYADSNNIERELLDAVSYEPNQTGRALRLAQSGDDLFIIIKNKDNVERVVGADARGLGILNMLTRYQEYLRAIQHGTIVQSLDDIIDISLRAIESADKQMDQSFKTYMKILTWELEHNSDQALDQSLVSVQEKYILETGKNSHLMGIRSGSVEGCDRDIKCIMNRITVIHNNLKILEKAGISGHFGVSCLSTEYQMLKHGLF